MVLHAMYSRTKRLITGTAVGHDMLEQIKPVWEGYVKHAIHKEGLGGHCWVKVK